MEVVIPSYVEVKIYYENDYEMCFLCGALSLTEYSQDLINREEKYIYIQIDIEEVNNFQFFIAELREQLERHEDILIDYTI